MNEAVSSLLSEADQAAYTLMTQRWLRSADDPCRARTDNLVHQLRFVHQFVSSSTEDYAMRSFVTGIFFCPDFIIVHTRRMAATLNRSKSAINCALQQGGFVGSREATGSLSRFFQRVLPPNPRLESFHRCSTEWGVRRMVEPALREAFFRIFFPTVPQSVILSAFDGASGSFVASSPLMDLSQLLSRRLFPLPPSPAFPASPS